MLYSWTIIRITRGKAETYDTIGDLHHYRPSELCAWEQEAL